MAGIGITIPSDRSSEPFTGAFVRALSEPLIANGFTVYTRVIRDAVSDADVHQKWRATAGNFGIVALAQGAAEERREAFSVTGDSVMIAVSRQHGDEKFVIVDVFGPDELLAGFAAAHPDHRLWRVGTSRAPENTNERFTKVGFEALPATSAEKSVSAAFCVEPATVLVESQEAAIETYRELAEAANVPPHNVQIFWLAPGADQKSARLSMLVGDTFGSRSGRSIGERMLALAIATGVTPTNRGEDQ